MRNELPESKRPIRDLIRRLIKAPAALAILWPVLLVMGGYMAWHRWGAQHVAAGLGGIRVESIQISDPPKYVRSDVVGSVYNDTAMSTLSLMDRTATSKIASAFLLHPWVRDVLSVRKLPGGVVDVRLDYRMPVAMARVFKPQYSANEKYYLPIDGEGVLLPSEEFARSETRDFIHIEIPGADSNNRPGTKFGDRRVEASAALAQMLTPFREQAAIKSIEVVGDSRFSDAPQLAIVTTDGRHFPWGNPPGMEAPGEATAEMKIQTLLKADGSEAVDLRMARPQNRLPPLAVDAECHFKSCTDRIEVAAARRRLRSQQFPCECDRTTWAVVTLSLRLVLTLLRSIGPIPCARSNSVFLGCD